MENFIVLFLLNLFSDLILVLIIKKIFKIYIEKIWLFFTVFLMTILFIICCYFGLKNYQILLVKTLSLIFVSLILTDSYRLFKLFKIWLSSILIMFSIFGFYKFMTAISAAVANEIFSKNLSKFAEFIIILIIFCYIFAIFWLSDYLSKKKIIESFLKPISFFAFGKHIKLIGLIDTGNVLYDEKTGKPVVVISIYSLKKYLPNETYENITKSNYQNIGFDGFIKTVSVGGVFSDIPILNIKKAIIEDGENQREFECVIGLVNHRFENSNKYDCLIHRDCV